MSLAAKLNSTPPSKVARECKTGIWIKSLSEQDQEAVRAALEDPQWSNAELLRTLKSEGYPYVVDTMGKHRRKECNCDFS